MVSLADMFRSGGPFMYMGLAFGLLTLMASCVGVGVFIYSLAKRLNRGPVLGCGGVLLVMTLFLVGIGVAGYLLGIAEMESALLHATPDTQEQLREAGTQLASYPLKLTAALAIFPGLVALVVLIRGLMPPKAEH
ncbi:MAG: hypothetical protein AAFX99_26315 [Myxococcota bacterium]